MIHAKKIVLALAILSTTVYGLRINTAEAACLSGPSQIASFELDTICGQIASAAGSGIQSTSQNR